MALNPAADIAVKDEHGQHDQWPTPSPVGTPSKWVVYEYVERGLGNSHQPSFISRPVRIDTGPTQFLLWTGAANGPAARPELGCPRISPMTLLNRHYSGYCASRSITGGFQVPSMMAWSAQ